MTARKHFVTPGKDASKVEEITWLENLAEDVQEGSYVKSLFTKEMVAWVSQNIQNDFPPDLHGALDYQYSLTSQAVLELNKFQNEYRQAVEVLKGTISILEDAAAKKQEYITTLEDKLQESNRQYRDAWNTACEATREASDMADKLQEMDGKIKALKLRIYDLEHGE